MEFAKEQGMVVQVNHPIPRDQTLDLSKITGTFLGMCPHLTPLWVGFNTVNWLNAISSPNFNQFKNPKAKKLTNQSTITIGGP